MIFLRYALLCSLLLLMVACSGDPAEEAEEAEGISYYSEIQPIMAQHCTGCHYPGQGAPIDLHNFEALREVSNLALANMETGNMPPWTPDPECREFMHQRVMPAEDIELFRQWIEEGMPEGTPPEGFEEFAPEPVPEPDIRAAISNPPYNPRPDISDEYRCFLLDQEFDRETFVTGTHVETDGAEVIHHANIFLVTPYHIDTVEALEASSEEPGYPCFGDPGFASINVVGAWVPGAEPIFLPEDSAVVIPEGSRLVMQTHFNTVFAEPEPVAPEVTLYTRDDPPSFRIRGMPFANMDLNIPAGESEAIHIQDYFNSSEESWIVLGVAPHLHNLATRVTLEVLHDDDEKTCLIDIPDWDFNWQQTYHFHDDDWVSIEPGEGLRMTCIFDNSASNQSVIDGVPQEPKDVYWGGRSEDEMCMAFLVVSEPYSPPTDGELCDEFVECRLDCDDPFAIGCIFNCGAVEMDCGVCLLQGAQQCANRHCPAELDAAQSCLVACGLGAQSGGDMDGCLQADCPEEADALEVCLRPQIETGQCNQDVQSCNVEF